MMEVLALIPARGGSKGIPKKNIKIMAGKPLIAYAIIEAKKSKHVTRIIVDTDSEEIAAVAKEYGAEVPYMRPAELAQDLTTDIEVFTHALNWLKEKENYVPDAIIQMRPTAPLRTAEHIDKGMELFRKSPEVDSVRSIVKCRQNPFKMWMPHGEHLQPFIPYHISNIPQSNDQPRQKLPEVYIHNASVDIMKPATILEKKSMTGTIIKFFVMEIEDSVNIDNENEFKLAELLLKQRQ